MIQHLPASTSCWEGDSLYDQVSLTPLHENNMLIFQARNVLFLIRNTMWSSLQSSDPVRSDREIPMALVKLENQTLYQNLIRTSV